MHEISIETKDKSQFLDITRQLARAIEDLGLEHGALMVYCPHTTAGVTINEGADPNVAADLQRDLERLVPWRQVYYRHLEGNSSSHTRATLVGSSALVPVASGQLALGTWQSVFFCEFDGPRRRRVVLVPLASH